MTKQTFTTGQVLTAAQMTSLQQTAMGGGSTTAKTASYVLVAADAGTVVQMNSASATTITVNTALFAAGDEVNIQNVGAGVCTVTAGTATVSTAGSLALSQYEGGQLYFNTTSAALFFDIVQSSGMTNPLTTTGDTIYSSSGTTPARLGIGSSAQVLTVASGLPSWATPSSGGVVHLKTASFSNVASTTTTFDAQFTSAYNAYTIVFNGITSGTGADDLQLQLRYAGPTTDTTNYRCKFGQLNDSAPVTASFTFGGSTEWTLSNTIGASAGYGISGTVQLNQLLAAGSKPIITWMNNGEDHLPTWGGGGNTNTRTYTGFLFKSSSSNITGSVSVYGLVNA